MPQLVVMPATKSEMCNDLTLFLTRLRESRKQTDDKVRLLLNHADCEPSAVLELLRESHTARMDRINACLGYYESQRNAPATTRMRTEIEAEFIAFSSNEGFCISEIKRKSPQ